MNVRESFQKNFSALFEAENMTQVDFAREIGVSRGLVSLWLHGESFPRADAMEKIAMHYRIPVSALVGQMSNEEEDNLEGDLLSLFRQLSPAGQRIAVDRVQELVFLYGKKYQAFPDQEDNQAVNQ